MRQGRQRFVVTDPLRSMIQDLIQRGWPGRPDLEKAGHRPHIPATMFSFFHPKPIGSRKAVAVLSVRQEARQEIGPHAVLVIRRAADADPPPPAPPAQQGVETNRQPG